MRVHKKIRSVGLILLVVVYVFCSCLTVTAVETEQSEVASGVEGDQEFFIRSEEEFADFALKCQSESYSKGRVFVLEEDLDFTGREFVQAGIFSGIFKGGGHKITGVTIQGTGEKNGLFRDIRAGAVVDGLYVEASLVPAKNEEKAGGIAGVNAGIIRACTFLGRVEGDCMVGGIAGSNEEGGLIEGCINLAEISSKWKAGGIAGSNEGTVSGCINKGIINADGKKLEEKEDENMSVEKTTFKFLIKSDVVGDTGGICGYSSGLIWGCTNEADVGCAHLGNNVGGIAGRQSGILTSCENLGKVLGSRNVAGICGHFEPYLKKFYEPDTLDELEEETDRIKEIKDTLSDQMKGLGDRLSDHMDRISDLADELKTMVREFSDNREAEGEFFDEEASGQMDIIEEIIDNMELELVSDSAEDAYEEIGDELGTIRKTLSALRKVTEMDWDDWDDEDEEDEEDYLEALAESYEEGLDLLSQLQNSGRRIVNNAEVLWEDGVGDGIDSIEEFTDDLDALRTEAGDLMDIIGDFKDDFSDDMKRFKYQMRDKTDEISDEAELLSDDLEQDGDRIEEITDELDDELDAVGDTLDAGKDRLKEKADEVEDDKNKLYDDVSAEGTDVYADGMITVCTNSGYVTGDYQSGGIVGILGYESLLEPEQDPQADGERTLDLNRTARALVRDCLNTGMIVSEYDYSGGIAGSARMGLILSCKSFSDVSALDGDYAGGIAGYCEGTITGCFMKGTISGTDYVGGITGFGKWVGENVAMSVIRTSDTEDGGAGRFHGSITGALDDDGTLSDNLYVDHGLGAKDGLTYEGEAQALSYEELVSLEGMPHSYAQMTVVFLADGEIKKEITCSYGERIDPKDIPPVPEKEGYDASWDEAAYTEICMDTVIRAIYEPHVTVIASSDEKKPLLLAEGIFYPNTRLNVWEEENWAEFFSVPEGLEVLECIGYEISPARGDSPLRLRLYAGSRAQKSVLLINNETDMAETAAYTVSGEYLVFEGGSQGTLLLLKKRPGKGVLAAGGTILAAASAGGIYLLRRKRKKNVNGEAANEKEDT